MFFGGLLIWFVIGAVAGAVAVATYRGAETVALLSVVFGVFGAFIGGMLGTAAYVYNDPSPLRTGGLIGAAVGSLFFAFTYHFVARRAL